jgi:hypothetical protein
MKKSIILTLVMVVFTSFGNTTLFAQSPTEAAPVPPIRTGSKVISVFSNAYTDVAGTIFTPFWNQSTVVSFMSITGNNTMRYVDFNWQGIELASSINALAMTHLHIDVWTSDETLMQIGPLSSSTPEVLKTLSPLNKGVWNSYDIPLKDFTSKGMSVADIFQFKLVGAGGHTVFIDNLYFYNAMEGEDIEGPVNFTVSAGLVTFNSIELLLNASDTSGAVFYEISSADSIIKLSNISGEPKSFTFRNLDIASVYNFTVSAKDYAGNEALNNPVTFSDTTLDSPPPAPIPPVRAAHKVISIFSEEYGSISGFTNFFPYWKQLTQGSMTDFQGNPALKYDNFNYQGIELGSDINALPMTHLHIDIWTPNETSLELAPISRSKTNLNYQLSPLKLNEWTSFDIPLSEVSGTWLSVSDIFQFFLKGTGGKVIYIDNFYFYNNSDVEDTQAPASFTATIGTVTFNSVELLLKASDNSGAVTFDISYGAKTFSVNGISGVTKSYTINALSSGTAYNFSIAVKDPTGNAASNNPLVVSATTVVATTAPVPTVKAADVISIFSDSYNNITGTNYNPNWNQTTQVSTFKIAGNSVLSYAAFNYQGTEFGSHVDASQMTHLHVDAWTANETLLQVTIISPGKEKLVSLTPLAKNKWNSYDISLSSFTGVNLADVFQFKFAGSGGKSVLLDNLYFYKAAPISIGEMKVQAEVSIYPNPVSENLFIASAKVMTEVQVISVSGQMLMKVSVNDFETTINMRQLSAGSYFIKIKHENGQGSVQKFIKQ